MGILNTLFLVSVFWLWHPYYRLASSVHQHRSVSYISVFRLKVWWFRRQVSMWICMGLLGPSSAEGYMGGWNFRFANNPICGPNAVTKPLPSQCSNITNGLETWTSPLIGQNTCLNISCPSGQTRNLQNCSCADPLVVLFLIRQPSFSIITDDLMAQLQQLLYVGLNLYPQQVWITNATFTNDERVNVTILFFPFNSAPSLDQVTVTNITSRLSQHNVTLGTFGLYSVVFGNGLIPGKFSIHLVVWGMFWMFWLLGALLRV